MDVAGSTAREVVKQHAGGVQDLEPSEENVSAIATRMSEGLFLQHYGWARRR